MSDYERALILTATAAFALSLLAHNWRGGVWTAALVVDLIASDAYLASGAPYADVFMAACDFLVCAAIHFTARHLWEMWIYRLFQASMLVSIIALGDDIWLPGGTDHALYLLALEVINYLALFVIWGVGGLVLYGSLDLAAFRPWRRFRPLVHPRFRDAAADQE